MKRKAIIYTRVSDPSQISNNSLETQLATCQKFAKSAGYEIIEVFTDEGKSAKHIFNRDQLRNAIRLCSNKTSGVTALIVYKIDRFSRNTEEGLAAKALLASKGVEVLSATEAVEDSPMGRLITTIMMGLGQLDNEIKGERVKDNMIASFRKGLWPFKCPIGYKRPFKTKEESKGLPPVLDSNLAPIITQMFKDAATGIYSKAQLARMMNIKGFASYYRAKATHKVVDDILKKTFYYGNMYATKWNEYALGKYEPMIDKHTWEVAYQRVILKKKNYHYQDSDLYPLKGYLRCQTCNKPLTTSPSRGRTRQYFYYECRNKDCNDRPRIMSSVAHDQFRDRLLSIKPSEKVLKLFDNLVFNEWDATMNSAREATLEIEGRISQLKIDQDNIRKAKQEGLYTLDEARSSIDNLRVEISTLEMERSDLKCQEYDVEIVREFTNHFLSNLDKLWDQADYSRKQLILEMIFDTGIQCTSSREIRINKLSPSFELIQTLSEQKDENVTL